MKKIITAVAGVALIALVGFMLFVSPSGDSDAKTVVVYKSASCGCCGDWVAHMKEAGYKVEVRNRDDMNAVKAKYGIKPQFAACHTALVDGYIIEGHVPAAQVARLLEERPAILGISVPGMPLGSPGMEQGNQSNYADYDVLAFDGMGRSSVFQHITADP